MLIYNHSLNFYSDQLRRNVSLQQYYIIIELSHLTAFDEVLATQLSRRPVEIVAMLEEAAKKLARHICNLDQNGLRNSVSIRDPLSDFQVQINSNSRPMTIRDLESTNISKFVRIPGIVISTSNTVARPTKVHAVCRGCGTVRFMAVNSAFGGVSLPRTCNGPNRETDVSSQPCPVDPFVIVAEKSKCVDQQTIKIQESPDMVPVGELPRHVLSTVDRFLVNKVTPGTRVIINGVYSIFQSTQKSGNSGSVAIRSPYIRVLGIQLENDSGVVDGSSKRSRQTAVFSESEEREMIAISRIPDIYSKFIHSIAPSIFGNDDIKKAIACLLFGGSRKQLPDKMRIRGDINVLLLGDPGVAKSQFLKFVEKVNTVILVFY
jgi:DNA replication licensing factor MCM5